MPSKVENIWTYFKLFQNILFNEKSGILRYAVDFLGHVSLTSIHYANRLTRAHCGIMPSGSGTTDAIVTSL